MDGIGNDEKGAEAVEEAAEARRVSRREDEAVETEECSKERRERWKREVSSS